MVAEGQLSVRQNDQAIREIRVGDFVGEASFLSRQPMPSDVVIDQPVRFLSWSVEDLEQFMDTQPAVAGGLQRVFGACLVRKLHAENAI